MEGKRGGFQSDRKKYRRFTWKRESRGFPASLPHDHHDGLAFQFSEPTAEKALAACHHEVFEQLLECPLEDFVCQLEGYMRSAYPDPSQTADVWEKLQAYRATIPLRCGPLAAGLFVSHVKVALTILKAHQLACPQDPQFASPHRLLGQ